MTTKSTPAGVERHHKTKIEELHERAADRSRRIKDEAEALAVLKDAVFTDDSELANAVGFRARSAGWTDAMDAFHAARPADADQAAALAVAENLSTDAGYNLASQIAYSAPVD